MCILYIICLVILVITGKMDLGIAYAKYAHTSLRISANSSISVPHYTNAQSVEIGGELRLL